MAKNKFVKIDNSSFNATHFAGVKKEDFIKHELASVPDSYGTKEKKIEFLESVHAAIEKENGTEKAIEKPKKQSGESRAICPLTTANDMIKRFSSLDIKNESFNAVSETKETITEIQKEQMFHGLNAEGKRIGRYRNSKYARAKNDMNPLPGLGVPDLKLRGGFYAGFKTEVEPEVFRSFSTDEKNDELTAKYDPFGLNKESKSEYAEKLKPVLVKNIRQKLMV